MKRILRSLIVSALIFVMVAPAWAIRTPSSIGRTDSDWIIINVRNVCHTAGTTNCVMFAGEVVEWVVGATNPGVDVQKSNTNDSPLIAGLIVGPASAVTSKSGTVASGELAAMLIYGYYAFAMTTGTLVNGDILGTSTTLGVADVSAGTAGTILGTIIADSVSGAPSNTNGVFIDVR